MRILIVSGLTHRSITGVQRETEQLLEGLVNHGVAVGMVTNGPLPAEGVHYFPIDYPVNSRAQFQIGEAVKVFRPDLLHVIGGGFATMRAVERARLNIPWSATIHNVPPFERTAPWSIRHGRIHYLLRGLTLLPSRTAWRSLVWRGSFAGLICHSQLVAEQAIRIGCPPQKLRIIPLAASPRSEVTSTAGSPFRQDAYPKILTVGAFAFTKGQHDFLRALVALKTTLPKLQYVCMGEIRQRGYFEYLLNEARRLGLADQVVLLKKVPEQEKLAALADADLYVQPSHEEGFCLAFLEAAAIVPRLVGTRTGAIPEMSLDDDPFSLIVPPRTPTALATAVLSVLGASENLVNAPQERRGALLTSRFSLDAYTRAHVDHYQTLLGEGSSAGRAPQRV